MAKLRGMYAHKVADFIAIQNLYGEFIVLCNKSFQFIIQLLAALAEGINHKGINHKLESV